MRLTAVKKVSGSGDAVVGEEEKRETNRAKKLARKFGRIKKTTTSSRVSKNKNKENKYLWSSSKVMSYGFQREVLFWLQLFCVISLVKLNTWIYCTLWLYHVLAGKGYFDTSSDGVVKTSGAEAPGKFLFQWIMNYHSYWSRHPWTINSVRTLKGLDCFLWSMCPHMLISTALLPSCWQTLHLRYIYIRETRLLLDWGQS